MPFYLREIPFFTEKYTYIHKGNIFVFAYRVYYLVIKY